jgi:hypothetical protein
MRIEHKISGKGKGIGYFKSNKNEIWHQVQLLVFVVKGSFLLHRPKDCGTGDRAILLAV